MNFELTRENMMIRNAIRDWVLKECTRDVIGDLDERGALPRKLFKKMSQLGFCGLTIPEKYKGEGRNILGACIVAEEIAYAFPVLSECYASSAFYGGAVISDLGSEDQKTKYLPACAAGKKLVALALSEDDYEEETATVKAIADGDHYVINGMKPHVNFGDQADLLILPVIIDGNQEDGNNPTLFCIETNTPGISAVSVDQMGYRGAGPCDIQFDNVRLSESCILGGKDQTRSGKQQPDHVRSLALLATAAAALGIARGGFDYSLEHAKQRVQFGQVIGKFPAINRKFAENAVKIDTTGFLIYKAAWLADQGKSFAREVAMAKCQAAETAVDSAMDGLQILGGYGYTMEYDMQRYVRDSVAHLSSTVSIDSLKLDLGSMLGL